MTARATRPDRARKSAASRGQRLYPSRSTRNYVVLTRLREEIERVIAAFVTSRRVDTLVDFGCGNMPYRPLFAPHVAKYVGCDLAGNELADSVMAHVDVLPLPDRGADIVLSTQVLEHVADPDRYLREIRRVVRPDGLMVLSTHGMWRYHPDPVDYWRWTSAGLKRVVEAAGFDVVSFVGIMGPQAAALQLWQEAVTSRVPSRLRRSFFRWVQWRIERADRRCTPEARDSDASVYLVVARPTAAKDDR